MSRSYDSQARVESVAVDYAAYVVHSVSYGYDVAGRLETVSSGSQAATYAYVPEANFIETVTFQHNSQTRMTTGREDDRLNRLTRIESSGAGVSPASSFEYTYNAANQRVRVELADGTRWESFFGGRKMFGTMSG